MMRVSNVKFETPITLESDSPFVVYVENPSEFFSLVQELRGVFDGSESEFSFWENDAEISAEKKGEIILSPFFFDLADKKIISLLHKRLNDEFLSGDYIVRFNEITSMTESFLYDLFSRVDFSIDFSELTLSDLLKAVGVKPSNDYATVLEKIVCYINIYAELKNISFFVLVGIKTVLSDEEITELYKHCSLQKISLLLIEGGRARKTLENERIIIVTEDLCEIVANIDEMS